MVLTDNCGTYDSEEHYKNHKLVDPEGLNLSYQQLKPALRCVWPARMDTLNHEFTLGQGVKIQATRTEREVG